MLFINVEKSEDNDRILDYYSNLYNPDDKSNQKCNCSNFLQDKIFPQISHRTSALCETVITTEEVKKAVISLDGNKSPGSDGLPSEFYKIISDLVLQSYLHAFESGKLPASQKQGAITLVPKKGKNLTDLKSWRPISVLNTDYKILAKVLATRIKKALPEIIDSDQIGYMQGRFCGENIRLISDIIDFCSFYKNLS